MDLTNAQGLTNSILEDAVTEANQIKQSAEIKKQQMLDAVDEEMRVKTQDILTKARRESENRKMRELAGNALDLKKQNLEQKRSLLNTAFDQALAHLR